MRQFTYFCGQYEKYSLVVDVILRRHLQREEGELKRRRHFLRKFVELDMNKLVENGYI